MKKNIMLKAVIVLLLVMMTSIGYEPFIKSAYAAVDIPEGFKMVAQTEKLSLYCHTKTGAIAVENRKTGYMWKSVVDESNYDFKNVNNEWKTYMTSFLTIGYTNIKRNDGNIQQAYTSADVKEARITPVQGGVNLDFDFASQGISISVEVLLENDNLIVRIPADKIHENGSNGLVNVDLMPLFGAADRKVDGYLMYPDGCGAITKYGDIDRRAKDVKGYTCNIYAPEDVNLYMHWSNEVNGKYQAMLPVFGIKNGNNAILAAATQGEADTSINIYPEGAKVNLNQAFFEFTYRHQYSVNLSSITINGKSNAKQSVGVKTDKNLINQDHEVRIFFMEGTDANYSGMANAYREYLTGNNLLKKSIRENSDIPLGVDYFMGISEKRLLFNHFIPMTTFGQAKFITEKFRQKGVKDIQVMFDGWNKNGYGINPLNWPPDKRLGGTKGFNSYVEYAGQQNIKVFLQNDFVQANTKGSGYSVRKDVVKDANNNPISDFDKSNFFLNPFSALKMAKSFLNGYRDYTGAGVSFKKIGTTIYHDYNRLNVSTRSKTSEVWGKILENTAQLKKPVAVEGGNAYVLKYADLLMNIPENASGYQLTDEVVPFYQMVVHGMIPYTSDAGNLSYDQVQQKLKWVEFGYMPYFELTYKKAVELKYTDHNNLFTSCYKDWIDTASGIYNEFNRRLKSVWCENMVRHEKINEKLSKVVYSNGASVYINYGETDAQCDGYKIPAQDYLVVEKGGKVK